MNAHAVLVVSRHLGRRLVSAWPAAIAVLALIAAGTAQATASQHVFRSGARAPSLAAVPVPTPSAQLIAMSCASPSFCSAIGYSSPVSGATFGEVWQGTAWHLVASPLAELFGISCPSAAFCMAVGQNGAQTWNGTTWSALPKSPPEAGVSCLSSKLCMAVGTGPSDTGIVHEWNGATWRQLTITFTCPPYHGGCLTNLRHVTCVSPTFCMAIGSIGSGTPQTIAAAWNGTAWTQEITPTVGPHSSGLDSLSCTSASFCMAVGETRQGQASMMTWDGTSWQLQTPSPAIPGLVSCTSDTSCVAAAGTTIEYWSGGQWQAFTPAVVPPGTTAGVAGLYCTGSPVSQCMLAGTYYSPDVGSLTLAEEWSGTTWQVLPTPTPGAVDGMLGASCPSASFCMAVGTFIGSGDVQQALAETWNGHGWKLLAPLSPGVQLNYLAGVDCTSASDCVAVGAFDTVLGDRQALAERWNGTTWTQLNAVDPELNDQLSAVSCASSNSCMAVGTSSVPTRVHTLAEQWNGTSWAVRTTPDPGSTHPVQQFNYLSGVSCPGPKGCIAVGYYNKRLPSGERSMAIAWNGRAWRLLSTPGNNGELASLSCLSVSRCLAAGADTNGVPAPTRTLALQWNGQRWVQRWPVGTGPGTAGGHLDGVACAGPASCLATGGYSTSAGQIRALAESWNGSSWRRLAAASPSPAFSELYSIDCARASACLAVGARATQLPLAELWNGARWRVLTPVNP